MKVERGGNRGGEKPRRVWTCTECGREGFWDEGWSWWGSLQDEDDGMIRHVMCSLACRASFERKPEFIAEQFRKPRRARR